MIYVRMTESMGRGVFAVSDIKAGTEMGRWHTLPTVAHVSPVSEYVFVGDDGRACVVFGWLSLVNHGVPNILKVWEQTPEVEVAVAVAARDIAAGEQLFHDYGFAEAERPAWAA